MLDKKLLIATGILVAGAAAVLLTERGTAPLADQRTGKTVLEGVSAAAVDKVELAKDGKTLTLVRAADQTWHLGDDKGFPVDAARLGRLLDDLGHARIEAIVAAKKEALAGFGLAQPARLTLDGGGKPLLSLALGDARKGGGQYLAFGDEAKAYLIGQAVDAPPDPDAWEHKVLLNLAKDQVKAISFTPLAADKAPATLARDKKEDPLKLEGLAADEKESPAVRNAESLAASVTFSKRYDKSNEEAKGAFARAAKTVITTFDGKTYTVLAGTTGSADKGIKNFLAVTGTPETDRLDQAAYFEVPVGMMTHFDKGRSDFVEKPAPQPPTAGTAQPPAAQATKKQ